MPRTTNDVPPLFTQLTDALAAHNPDDDLTIAAARLLVTLDESGATLVDKHDLATLTTALDEARQLIAAFPAFEIAHTDGKPFFVKIDHPAMGRVEGYVESRSQADRRARLNDAAAAELLGWAQNLDASLSGQ